MTIEIIAKKIKLLVLDCDGILTDGTIYVSHDGQEMIGFNVLDGIGIERLQKSGVIVAVISGRQNAAVQHRLERLRIQHIFLGKQDKIAVFEALIQSLQLNTSEVAYAGDDFLDIPVMEKIALPMTVPNAIDAVKKIALFCASKHGGRGAVREMCDLIYFAQNS